MPEDYLVFSLKYRPQTFDEIKCQDPARDTLKKAIENNRVAHAYLFCGPRGVGKTTTARILAKALNCVNGPTTKPCGVCPSCKEITSSRSMDVIEIDGASNRQIDDIRDLRESIKYAPSAGRYKIYIIDEVHMLTEFAFNALLKTLEEPPRHAKFIFATTAPHKVPSTILSRCQRFDFRKAGVEELVALLRGIAGREKIRIDDESLYAVARRAEGSIRDSETILDQIHAFRPEGVTLKDVEHLLGIVPGDILVKYAELLRIGTPAELLTFANEVFDRGYNLVEFVTGLAGHLRTLLALRLGISRDALGFSAGDLAQLEEQAKRFTARELSTILEAVVGFEEDVKYTTMPRILLEVMTLKLAAGREGAGGSQSAPVTLPPAAPAPVTAVPVGQGKTRAAEAGPAPSRSSAPATKPRKVEADSQTPAAGRSVWDSTLTELRQTQPILAAVLEPVTVLEIGAGAIRITRPVAPMWNEKELSAELKSVEDMLSRFAGRTMKIEICDDPKPGSTGSRSRRTSAIDKLRAVYDCEEL